MSRAGYEEQPSRRTGRQETAFLNPEVVTFSVDQPDRAGVSAEVSENIEVAERRHHIGNHLGGDPAPLYFRGHSARQHAVENSGADTFATVASPREQPMRDRERHGKPPSGNTGRPGDDQP